MNTLLPPIRDTNRLNLELRLTPGACREDAIQEAWLAHLERRDPATAVNTYARRERRHRQRESAVDPVYVLPTVMECAVDRRLAAPHRKVGPVSGRAGGKRVLRRGPAPKSIRIAV